MCVYTLVESLCTCFFVFDDDDALCGGFEFLPTETFFLEGDGSGEVGDEFPGDSPTTEEEGDTFSLSHEFSEFLLLVCQFGYILASIFVNESQPVPILYSSICSYLNIFRKTKTFSIWAYFGISKYMPLKSKKKYIYECCTIQSHPWILLILPNL